ncbi:MAG: cytochrome P450 [Roseinatronobacter sp.]
MTRPPMPDHRPDRVPLLRHLAMFRDDILSTQPARLYRAKMAEVKLPFLQSVMVNTPDLVRLVLQERPRDFPKSERVREGLRLLLGDSVFVTNGPVWERQRRMIDPAFEGGRLRETFPAMWDAAQASAARLHSGEVEIEEVMSHAAADVIFRTLFSLPIEDATAAQVYQTFRAHQRSSPILNLAALIPLPRLLPRYFPRATRQTAAHIRALITQMVDRRAEEIAAGTAPDDLATKIMTTRDPETGATFSRAEMVDQVAIFFLAGHETSASALAWTLYLLASHPDWQEQLVHEAQALRPHIASGTPPDFGILKQFPLIRDTFRESLRLYPPVPMLVRETTRPERFRNRPLGKGAQVVVSLWHMGRNENIWDAPHEFHPERWQQDGNKACARDAFLPFSSGPRVCTGAGFAMAEAVLILARLLCDWQFSTVPGKVPVPMAHMTVRARDGIWLDLQRR